MRTITITIILFIIFSINGYSQQSRVVRVGAGFESHKMDQLKSFQDEMIIYVRINDVKVMESFPDNIYYSVAYYEPIGNKSQIGLNLSYLTTGGRNHVSDYSGEYKLDMLLNGYKGGVCYKYSAGNLIGNIDFALQLKAGVVYTELALQETLQAYESSQYDESVFSALTAFAEPAIIFSHTILDNFYIDFSVGYQFDIYQDKFALSKNSDYNIDTKPEWDGIRTSIGLSYKL
ncbi:MAG: hypothetical protein ACQESX_09395 [Bacteroidota bacterium]